MPRVALFLDFENLYNALKDRARRQDPRHPYGASPFMDFGQLVTYIEENYGTLAREDFIAVANFTHYNPQKGGLNRYATVIDAQSFLGPQVRRQRQRTRGKKWVIRNFADMRLAFEVGRHVATRPADLYMLGSGDEAFTAIGRTLREMGLPVVFLVADPEAPSTDANIRTEFDLLDFLVTQHEPPPRPEPPSTAAEEPPDAVAQFCATLSELRRQLSTGIPVRLMEALYGPQRAGELIRKAQGSGRVDLWEGPTGIPCLSLQEERVLGKVQKMATRPGVARAAAVLGAVVEIAAQAPRDADRAFWRRALRQRLGVSSKAAKGLLERLLSLGVLRDGWMTRPRVTVETVLTLSQEDLPGALPLTSPAEAENP